MAVRDPRRDAVARQVKEKILHHPMIAKCRSQKKIKLRRERIPGSKLLQVINRAVYFVEGW